MIDFRYHLVSLISVFLALAVGIVLGAGPLRDTISDQLTGQVEVLREEKEALRVEVDGNRKTIAGDAAFIEASAEALLADALPDYRVAVLTTPGTRDDVVSALTTRIEEAGGEITARGELTADWATPAGADARDDLADDVRPDLTGVGSSAATEEVLGAGLGLALTGASDTDPRVPSPAATAILATLTEGDAPLLRFQGESAPADLVLVVTAAQEPLAPDATADPDLEPTNVTWALTLAALADDAPTVVGGYAAIDTDLLVRVRGERVITTVDGIGGVAGQITVPLALAAAAGGEEPRPYGVGIGAQEPLPPRQALTGPVALEPADPVLPTDPSTPDGATDGEATDGETPADEATPTDGETTDGGDGA